MPHTGPDVAPGSRLTAPGFSEAFWLGSRGSGRHLPLSVVARFGFGGGHVADGLEQPAVVEPVHPLKRGELDRLKGPPRPASVDHLGLVEAVDRLGECVVKTVADAADRGLDARRSQALGVANRDILPGFKRSSQHLERGGCDDRLEAAFGSVRARRLALAWSALCCAA